MGNKIVEYAIQNLSEENKELIKNKELENLSDHIGVSMILRNIIYSYKNEKLITPENLNLEFYTTEFIWKGELNENYLLEKLWRIFNGIEFNEEDVQNIKKIIGNSENLFLEIEVRNRLIKYINKLKK